MKTVDVLVRAIPGSDQEIRRHLPKPLDRIPLGSPFGQRYVPPIDDIHPDATFYADPALTASALRDRGAVEIAVLLAPNYQLRADRRHEVAVMQASNRWLAETWLASDPDLYRGSIQLSPRNVAASLHEIETWSQHPGFVQIAVPLQAHAPYGEQEYFPLWEAAAAAGLPVSVHGDGNGGVELPPAMAGPPASFLEYHTIYPLSAMVHLVSLISEGVFDRLPGLTVIFTDGCAGVFPPFLWREDAKARALKEEMPWVSRRPTEYLNQVRFVPRRDDLPRDPEQLATMIRLARDGHSLLYGSNYPMWDLVQVSPGEGPSREAMPDGFFEGNALGTYPRLGIGPLARG